MVKRTSPTERTLKALRSAGHTAAVTERWNPYARVRVDLFGFVDLIYLDPERGVVGIQCTSATNHSHRRVKILTETREAARQWLLCGGLIEIWSWRKRTLKRGGKAVKWEPRVEAITLDDFSNP